jgi:HSP20 family protein
MSGSGAAFPWRRKRIGLQSKAVHPVVGLQQQMNRLFNEFFSGSALITDWVAEPLQQLGDQFSGFVPNVHMVRTDTEVIVVFEVPGIDENDLELTLTRDFLTIRGYRRWPEVAPAEAVVAIGELEEGPFERTIALDVPVNEDGVEASFTRGMLVVTMPRLPVSGGNSKVVPIRPASSGRA